MADKETPSKKASDDASKDKVSQLKADSQTKKKNRISGIFNFLKKKDKEDSSDHKEDSDAHALAHLAEGENDVDSGPNSSTLKNGTDTDDKKKKSEHKKDDDKKKKSGHRKIKSSYDGKTRDPLADSEDTEKKKKKEKEKEKSKSKDKKDKKDKKKDKKDEPESTTDTTQTKEETDDKDKQQKDFEDLQKQAADLEDIVAAYQTHDTRTQEQKYRTLSRQKSYKEKWGQRTISSKSIRMAQVERKVVYDLFTAPAQQQPAQTQTGSAAATPRVEITITKAPTPAQEISVDLPKETVEADATSESSTLKKRALPRRGANKPATKFDMVQKFNQKLNKQAGAEEVEVEAPQPENITIDDKPAAEEPRVTSLAIEPLTLEVTEEVVVLQVTPREHYKETVPDAKPEVKPTPTETASPVKQPEPKKEDIKPVETKHVPAATPSEQPKPAITVTTPAASSASPLDQFFQAGQNRREQERIQQEERKAQNQKEVLASARKWDRERDNQETAKMYKVAVKKAVEQVHRVRLMHCKGKRRVWVREAEVSAKSLNEGDAFVLDLDKVIYVWNGAKANAVEKSKAVGIATMIRDHERASHATIVTVDKYAKDEDQEAFWKALGGKPETIASREEGGDDEQYEKDMMDNAKLFKVEVEDNGQTRLEVVLQPEKKLLMEMLVDTEIYVLDCGNEVYGWYGRDCSETKRNALKGETKKLFKQETRASWAQMFMVGQGGEPFLFRERFADWPDLSHQSAIKKMFRQHESLNVKKVYSNKFNVETMLLNLRPEDDVPCPDGEGTLKVWMVKDKRTKIEVPEEEFGHFYSGQCYIILYEYKKNNALRYIIWTWQGKDSSKLEQGFAVKFTEDLYRHYSRTLFIVQQMIFQNKETLQFMLAFQGLYIIYRGRKEDALDKVAMYHLRGTDILPIHAIQTKTVSAARLNSRDAFVVRNTASQMQYVWYGKALGQDMDKIALADELANNMNEFDETRGIEIKLVVKILEGEEPAEFWEAVGGKKPYANDEFLSSPQLKMHLFHCTAAKTANAVFSANEIYEFYQEDLLSKDIFILDAYFELFVWIGSKSTEMKKRSALEIAAEYLTLLKERENRGCELNTSVIEEGKEPLRFKALFHDWEDPAAPVTEVAAQSSQAAKTDGATTEQKPAAGVTETLQVFYQKYPYELLKTNAPKECDRSQLEVHLTDEEFEKVFGMTRTDFAKVPKWKQLLEKKKLGLF